jgi:PhoPQ-activated pathogenicity-related protein
VLFLSNTFRRWKAYGNWSFAFKDYTELNFTGRLDDDTTTEMLTIVDPAAYYDRYANIPKLVVNAGGDEFLMVDDNRYALCSKGLLVPLIFF